MNCIVTGASKGIGRATAEIFSQHGYKTFLLARSEKILKNLSKQLRGTHSYVCDVSRYNQFQVVVREIVRDSGQINVLVNAAAVLGNLSEIYKQDTNDWRQVIETNLNGSYYAMRLILPHMIANRSGIMVNFTSNMGRDYRKRAAAYGVSKSAVETLTNVADAECREHSVRCFALNPGRTATDMRRKVAPDEDRSILTKPQEIAEFILKLCETDRHLSLPCSIDYSEWKDKIEHGDSI